MEPHLKQCNIWDEIVCFVSFLSQFGEFGTSIPALPKDLEPHLLLNLFSAPKGAGKKLMNLFLGQDIGLLRQANLKM